MGALTPPVMADSGRRVWLRNVAALSLAGLATSLLVGMTLGYVGDIAGLRSSGISGAALLMPIAALAIAREGRWTSMPLLQVRRQTPRAWGTDLGLHPAAWLWGFDVGLFFTTWLTFAGVWLVPLAAVVSGSPGFGAAMLAAYWTGRTLSLWLGPLLIRTANDSPRLMAALRTHYRTAQLVHVGIVLWIAVILTLMIVNSVSI